MEKRPDRAILETLIEMFHGKCAYCETPDANHIDHFWPKSPHPTHNANKGTPERMFVWDNLFLSCHKCNSWECKGAHMKWDNGRPRLLNPCLDDPLYYFDINVDYQVAQSINLGKVNPHANLSRVLHNRARYTIDRLKLNERESLRIGRAQTILHFQILLEGLNEFGPEREMPSGRSIRKGLLDLLHPLQPYLASIRQFLHDNPDVKSNLLIQIPELVEAINQWALPLGNCD